MNKDILLRELKAWLMKDGQGRAISPITSLHGVYNGKSPFKPYFDHVENMIKEIVGKDNELQCEFSFNDIVNIVTELLKQLNNPEVVLTPNVPPVADRESNRFYLECTEAPGGKGYIRRPVGVRVDLEKNTIERLGEGVGKTLDDFYNILPWAGRRRCHISDSGDIMAYFTDNNFDTSARFYNTMVQIPLFYYKRIPIKVVDNKLIIWEDWISYDAVDGFYIHPAFIKNEKIHEHIYVGAYEGVINSNNRLCSIPDATTTRMTLLDAFRESARNRGKGWELVSYDYLEMERLLFLVSSASFDCQLAIGRGNQTGSLLRTGGTKNMGTTCGSSGENGKSSVNFFGVENLWSNCWCYYDGAYLDGDKLKINKDYDDDSMKVVASPIHFDTVNTISHFMSNNNEYDYLYSPYCSSEQTIVAEAIDHIRGMYAPYGHVAAGGQTQDNDYCGLFTIISRSLDMSDTTTTRIMYYPEGRPIYD